MEQEQVRITGKHIEITPALKEYASKKMSKIKKYLHAYPFNAHITLSVEKYRHYAEVSLHVNKMLIHGKEETENMYSSIDKVMDKIEHQVKKYKEKMQNKKGTANRIIPE